MPPRHVCGPCRLSSLPTLPPKSCQLPAAHSNPDHWPTLLLPIQLAGCSTLTTSTWLPTYAAACLQKRHSSGVDMEKLPQPPDPPLNDVVLKVGHGHGLEYRASRNVLQRNFSWEGGGGSPRGSAR